MTSVENTVFIKVSKEKESIKTNPNPILMILYEKKKFGHKNRHTEVRQRKGTQGRPSMARN